MFAKVAFYNSALLLTPDDFKSILVISALKRDDPIKNLFEAAFEVVSDDRHTKIDLQFVQVNCESDLAKALNEFNGPMVIFDGHDSHRPGGVGMLHLGDEAVDVWTLKDKITNMPPIVILSACDTHAADRNHATNPSAGTTSQQGGIFTGTLHLSPKPRTLLDPIRLDTVAIAQLFDVDSFTSEKIARRAGNRGESRAFPPPDSRALWAPSRRHRHVDFTLQHRDGDIDRLGCRGHHFGESGGA